MTHIYILLNHDLTERQIAELYQTYGADAVLEYPPPDIKAFWSQVPPEPTLPQNEIDKILQWLAEANPNDVLLVQGDYSATFALVVYALRKGMTAIHAVTKRVASEVRTGEQVARHYVFEHECFREYKWYEKEE